MKAWQNADVNKRRELVKALFPPGLPYSNNLGYFELSNSGLRAYKTNWLMGKLQNVPTRWKKGYFEPGNDELMASNCAGLEDFLTEEKDDSELGVPKAVILNHSGFLSPFGLNQLTRLRCVLYA